MIMTPNVNVIRKMSNGLTEYLYRFDINKNGTFRVRAKYTGLKTGAIGSGGKSFKTEAERDAALLMTCLLLDGWGGWSITAAGRAIAEVSR